MRRPLIIPEVDEAVLDALRARASLSGHTIEEEARIILNTHLSKTQKSEPAGFASRIQRRILEAGGLETLEPQERDDVPRYAEFGESRGEDGI